MSAVSLFAAGQAAFLLTDRASYHDDGTVLALRSKVVAVDRLKLAVARTGAMANDVGETILRRLEAARDQAAALAALPALVAELHAEASGLVMAADTASGHTEAVVQLYIAAWLLEAGRPACFVIGVTQGTFGPGYRPGALARVSSVVSPPVREELHPSWPGFDVTLGAERIADAQRESRDDRGLCRVGGAAELTTVDAAGVRTRVLRTWPDRVGERIKL